MFTLHGLIQKINFSIILASIFLILISSSMYAKDHPDQQKIDYYNNLNGNHVGSTIADWTDADYTSELSADKAAAFGTNFYVPAGRDSDHTIQVCIDYWYT